MICTPEPRILIPEFAASHSPTVAGGGASGPQAVVPRVKPDAHKLFSEADIYAAARPIIIKEILANGRLTEANHGAEFAMSLERVRRVAHRMTVAAEAIALAAGLARPWADVVLTGAATVEQLRSSIASRAIPWSDAIEEQLDDAAVPSSSYWRSRSGFAWSLMAAVQGRCCRTSCQTGAVTERFRRRPC